MIRRTLTLTPIGLLFAHKAHADSIDPAVFELVDLSCIACHVRKL